MDDISEHKKSIPGLSRRGFLGLALPFAAVLGLGGAVRLWSREQDFVRPPGALPGQDFVAACIKCQRCIDICPTLAVQSVTLPEDLFSSDTPRMNFGRGICNFCMKCTQVCPTGALSPVPKETARLGVAKVKPEICIAWTWVGCTRCYDQCPYDAIELDANSRPVVIAGKCNGCGECEHICSSTSLRSSSLLSSKEKGIVVQPLAERE